MSAQISLVRAPDSIVTVETPTPTVYFDTRLGKLYDTIDFDTEEYTAYLLSRGLTDEQVAQTSVSFNYAPLLGHLVKASYNRPQSKININATHLAGKRTLNKAVYHETEHRIADATDTRAPTAYTIASNACQLLGLTGLAAGSAVNISSDVLGAPEVFTDYARLLARTSLVLMAISSAIYYTNPEERRAFKAASHYDANLVDIN
jgi:hypothetical protein